MEVGLLSQWGDVACAQPLSAPLQNGLRLLHPPLPVTPISVFGSFIRHDVYQEFTCVALTIQP
jgi:hypothetical protein